SRVGPEGAHQGAAEGSRHRRVLPRPVLRDGGRGRGAAPEEGLQRAPHGARHWRVSRPWVARRVTARIGTQTQRSSPMIFKPYYYFETGCAAYLFGCGGLGKCAVV